MPTSSPLCDRVIATTVGAHRDASGRYAAGEPHVDWRPSGAGFDERRFAAIRDRLAGAIAGDGERRPAAIDQYQ